MAGNDEKVTFGIIVAGYAITRRRRSKRSVNGYRAGKSMVLAVGNTLLRKLRVEYALMDDY